MNAIPSKNKQIKLRRQDRTWFNRYTIDQKLVGHDQSTALPIFVGNWWRLQ